MRFFQERLDLERQEKERLEAKIEEMRNQALVLLKEEKLKYETRLVEAQGRLKLADRSHFRKQACNTDVKKKVVSMQCFFAGLIF